MANEKNLIVPSSKVARENGKKGGLKKAENDKKRKSLKEELLLILSEGNTQKKISIALIEQAQKGNTKAFEIIRDTIEEKPKDKLQVEGEINNPFSGMTTEELRKIANSE